MWAAQSSERNKAAHGRTHPVTLPGLTANFSLGPVVLLNFYAFFKM